MPDNLLVTGPPRSGKTTVVERVVDRLEQRGYRVGGLYSPEVREDGERIGFDIRDAMTVETRVLARVDREAGPSVGKYRVAVEHVDALAEAAIDRALEAADVVVVDEIAPMEVESDSFVRAVRRALEAETPVLAAVHHRSQRGFVGAVKDRDDAERFEVTPDTRDALPGELFGRLDRQLVD
ncbi:MAG: NTPase [Halobacteriales archaeon]